MSGGQTIWAAHGRSSASGHGTAQPTPSTRLARASAPTAPRIDQRLSASRTSCRSQGRSAATSASSPGAWRRREARRGRCRTCAVGPQSLGILAPWPTRSVEVAATWPLRSAIPRVDASQRGEARPIAGQQAELPRVRESETRTSRTFAVGLGARPKSMTMPRDLGGRAPRADLSLEVRPTATWA